MSHSKNSQPQTPSAGQSHGRSDAPAATEPQGMEQMAFLESAAGDDTSAHHAVTAPMKSTGEDAAAADGAIAAGRTALLPESLAQHFVAAREVRGWSQQQVATKLHLPLHVVKWIEAGQYDRVGEGVYLRGYLSNYARLVGVPAAAVEEVLRSKTPPPPELVATGQISHSRYLVERYSGSALYLVLTGVIFVPLVMFAMNMGGNVGSRLTPLDAPVPALASAESNGVTPAESSPATLAGEKASTVAVAPSSAPVADSHDSPVMASFGVVPPLPAADGAKPVAASVAADQLRLTLAEASWVEIVDADGKRLEYSTLPAGTVKEYPADKSLTILLGNTNGARVEVDGQVQDIAPHNRGNVARFKLAAGSRSITAAASEHNG